MREILFRGKRVDNGELVYGDLIQLHDGRKYIIDNKFGACIDDKGNFINTESPFVNEVIPETVSQYTGLTDKNGKNIFEGDILTSDEYPFKDDGDNYIGIVYFYDNVPGFEYELRCINPKKRGISNGINNNFEPNDNLQVELEVIGNIFDKEVNQWN